MSAFIATHSGALLNVDHIVSVHFASRDNRGNIGPRLVAKTTTQQEYVLVVGDEETLVQYKRLLLSGDLFEGAAR